MHTGGFGPDYSWALGQSLSVKRSNTSTTVVRSYTKLMVPLAYEILDWVSSMLSQVAPTHRAYGSMDSRSNFLSVTF